MKKYQNFALSMILIITSKLSFAAQENNQITTNKIEPQQASSNEHTVTSVRNSDGSRTVTITYTDPNAYVKQMICTSPAPGKNRNSNYSYINSHYIVQPQFAPKIQFSSSTNTQNN